MTRTRAAEALAAYREARTRWQQLGLPFDDGVMAIEMASVLDPAEADVATAVDDARATFTRMGLVPLLALLDRTAAREVSTAARTPRRPTSVDAPIPNA